MVAGTGMAPFRAFWKSARPPVHAAKTGFSSATRSAVATFFTVKNSRPCPGRHPTRLDTAFSRDQTEKIYVQTRMLEHAKELWTWLEEGAHFYVCGDAKRMAKDVDAALREVIQMAGTCSPMRRRNTWPR